MSGFAEVIGCDKVGQQPLVQSVLKGSKKLKPQGSKRRRLRSLSCSVVVFLRSHLINTLFLKNKKKGGFKVNCFSLSLVDATFGQ